MDSILHAGDRRHAAFMQNADIVIHDAQYTPEEYPAKKNWGHSTYTYVVGIAAAANVKHLFLTHHDPSHDDDFLDHIEAKAREIAASLGSTMEISCAREGFHSVVEGDLKAAQVEEGTPKPVCVSGADDSLLILIVDDDEDLRVFAREVLVRAGHRVVEASSATSRDSNWQRRIRLICWMLDLNMPDVYGL